MSFKQRNKNQQERERLYKRRGGHDGELIDKVNKHYEDDVPWQQQAARRGIGCSICVAATGAIFFMIALFFFFGVADGLNEEAKMTRGYVYTTGMLTWMMVYSYLCVVFGVLGAGFFAWLHARDKPLVPGMGGLLGSRRDLTAMRT